VACFTLCDPQFLDSMVRILTEYWLSSLKVVTVILFIIVGTFVNAGYNTESRVIGFDNWKVPGAPFVGGFGGFARVFVTASYACELTFLYTSSVAHIAHL